MDEIKQLKSECFDILRQIEFLQAQLKAKVQKIGELEQQPKEEETKNE